MHFGMKPSSQFAKARQNHGAVILWLERLRTPGTHRAHALRVPHALCARRTHTAHRDARDARERRHFAPALNFHAQVYRLYEARHSLPLGAVSFVYCGATVSETSTLRDVRALDSPAESAT